MHCLDPRTAWVPEPCQQSDTSAANVGMVTQLVRPLLTDMITGCFLLRYPTVRACSAVQCMIVQAFDDKYIGGETKFRVGELEPGAQYTARVRVSRAEPNICCLRRELLVA